ncbi:hypothetical protein MKZ02_12615 [Pseudobacillus sp. FSL P4-0506]|uniref:hypothetical protein n=1 Tax=Pseudobacillus sp. FSL P4-0506 TaxID=2921576 RepID=UPI0030FCBEA8
MRRISKFIKTLFFGKYEGFANQLGFTSWNEVLENTFSIFQLPPDCFYFATQLLDGTWIVWNDEGYPPYAFLKFNTWNEAIKYLRMIFNENGYPEEYWNPEGFEEYEDVFNNLPDKDKKIE